MLNQSIILKTINKIPICVTETVVSFTSDDELVGGTIGGNSELIYC